MTLRNPDWFKHARKMANAAGARLERTPTQHGHHRYRVEKDETGASDDCMP
jgi:hypothetical protein